MKTPLWRRCLAVFACFLLFVPSLPLPLVAQGAADAEAQQIAAALDANGDRVLNDAEIRQAIQFWIGGSVVPGTNRTISDEVVQKLIQMWILGQTITSGPTGSLQIEGVFDVDVDADGRLVAKGNPLQAALAGRLVMVTGKRFPDTPLVEVSGVETQLVAHSDTALVTFVPFAGPGPQPVELVISDRNPPSATATTRFPVAPFDAASSADPARAILDFVQATGPALAGEARSAQTDDLLRVLTQLEDAIPMMSGGERRSVAASVVASNILTLLGKTSAAPQAMGPSMAPVRPAQDDDDDDDPGSGAWFIWSLLLGGAAAGLIIAATNDNDIQLGGGTTVVAPRAPNAPLNVSFAEISNQAPVEGDPQSFSCLAQDDDTIARIKVAVQAGAEAHFVDASGNPVPELTLERPFSGAERSEKFSIQWNSTATGQTRDVVFTCTAYDDPAYQGWESKSETLTLPIKAASTPEPGLPDTAPSVLNITGPSSVAGDGQPIEFRVDWEDPNGDVVLLEVFPKIFDESDAIVTPFEAPLSILRGITSGSFEFVTLCENPGTDSVSVTLEVTLVDAKGLRDQNETTYTCEGTGTPAPPPLDNTAPVIVDIEAPGFFPGDGQPHDVTVNFADQNGNVAQLRIETIEGPNAGQPPQTLTLDVAGLVTGEITFSISCQNTGSTFFNVTQRLVLIDAAGLESAPKSHAYTCEPVGSP